MVNYCPKCGAKIVTDAAFCVACGIQLSEIGASPNTAPAEGISSMGRVRRASSTIVAKGRQLFGFFRLFRRRAEESPAQPQSPRRLLRPAFFYGILIFLAIGVFAAVLIPIAAGQPPRGQEVAGAAFWSMVLVYLVLRRRNTRKIAALLFSILAFVVIVPLIGLVDGVINRDRYALNREFANNPALAAIKENDPKVYNTFLIRAVRISRDSNDKDVLAKAMVAEVGSLYRRYLRQTTDAALIALYRAQLRRMITLRTADPERCYRNAQGQYASTSSSALSFVENRDVLEMMAAAVAAGVDRPERPFNKAKAEESIDRASANAELLLGAEARLLNLIDDPKGDFAGACKGRIALMQSVLELPSGDSANVLRSLVAQ